jgi:hypothetical protein
MLNTNKTFEGTRFYSLPIQDNSHAILWFFEIVGLRFKRVSTNSSTLIKPVFFMANMTLLQNS